MQNEEFKTRKYQSRKNIDLAEADLSIFIDNEVFSYCIFGKKSKEPHVLFESIHLSSGNHYRSPEDILHYHLSNQTELRSVKGRVMVTLLNDRFTIFPSAFNNAEHARKMLQFTGGLQVTSLRRDQLNDMCVAYTADAGVLKVIETNFRSAVIRHSASVLPELFLANRSLRKSEVLVNFSAAHFEIVARKDEKIVFYNVFEYENKDDVLYYLLFMMQQYGFDTEISRVALSGNIEVNGELHQALKKYVRFLGFAVNDMERPQAIEWDFPDHHFFTCLNRIHCGS